MNRTVTLLALIPLAALAACARAPEVTQGTISPQARALMPIKQDLSRVVKGADGCYYEVMEGSLSGYLSPFQDPFREGRKVCDPKPAEG
ncbi:hypothetical protein PSA7680_00330 [Pseudoruegeria aquimaris]|uniref:Lipoprotein n=1 Tax=Pseudoruegeria aquimaris TaxID=393663 RepID=A0A1Y5RGX5_9RHOB|nr:hypothetical protein [Pseudoruegeria aquimaris]SLN14434.1 hypothetical protein PSA7680_00330 [Pseudoruegeria aquimaris]